MRNNPNKNVQKKAGSCFPAILFYFGANANFLWVENNSYYRKIPAPGKE